MINLASFSEIKIKIERINNKTVRMSQNEYLDYWNSLYAQKNYFGEGPTKLALLAEKLFQEKKNAENSRSRMWSRKRLIIFLSIRI